MERDSNQVIYLAKYVNKVANYISDIKFIMIKAGNI